MSWKTCRTALSDALVNFYKCALREVKGSADCRVDFCSIYNFSGLFSVYVSKLYSDMTRVPVFPLRHYVVSTILSLSQLFK